MKKLGRREGSRPGVPAARGVSLRCLESAPWEVPPAWPQLRAALPPGFRPAPGPVPSVAPWKGVCLKAWERSGGKCAIMPAARRSERSGRVEGRRPFAGCAARGHRGARLGEHGGRGRSQRGPEQKSSLMGFSPHSCSHPNCTGQLGGLLREPSAASAATAGSLALGSHGCVSSAPDCPARPGWPCDASLRSLSVSLSLSLPLDQLCRSHIVPSSGQAVSQDWQGQGVGIMCSAAWTPKLLGSFHLSIETSQASILGIGTSQNRAIAPVCL